MKNCRIYFYQLLLLSVITSFTLTGCKKKNVLTPSEKRIKELSGTWQLGTVINDEVDVTSQFHGFLLTIEGEKFTTNNGGNAWSSIGNYVFVDGDINKLLRDDGIATTIVSISTKELVVSFIINQVTISGRNNGITGNFTFSLIKQ